MEQNALMRLEEHPDGTFLLWLDYGTYGVPIWRFPNLTFVFSFQKAFNSLCEQCKIRQIPEAFIKGWEDASKDRTEG